jgi:hypothetical protein
MLLLVESSRAPVGRAEQVAADRLEVGQATVAAAEVEHARLGAVLLGVP